VQQIQLNSYAGRQFLKQNKHCKSQNNFNINKISVQFRWKDCNFSKECDIEGLNMEKAEITLISYDSNYAFHRQNLNQTNYLQMHYICIVIAYASNNLYKLIIINKFKQYILYTAAFIGNLQRCIAEYIISPCTFNCYSYNNSYFLKKVLTNGVQ